MTTTVLITLALLALVLWTMIPTTKSDTTTLRNQHNDDNQR